MKIKLFTHNDLDGIGCAILAYLAFERERMLMWIIAAIRI